MEGHKSSVFEHENFHSHEAKVKFACFPKKFLNEATKKQSILKKNPFQTIHSFKLILNEKIPKQKRQINSGRLPKYLFYKVII